MEGNLLERKSIAGCRRENPYVLWLRYSTYGFWVEMGGMHMSARNHEVTAKQQLLDANGNIPETVLDAFPMGKLQMPTNSSEGDIVYEKKNLRLKYVLEKNPENLSERSAVGKSIAGKEKQEDSIITRKSIVCARKVSQNMDVLCFSEKVHNRY